MLFTDREARDESSKERNLYAKVLIGYWFNELVPGVDDRTRAFSQILEGGEWRPRSAKRDVPLSAATTRVTLDYHAPLDYGQTIDYRARRDHGECADVLIVDSASRTMIAIEAKLDTDWDYDKDVRANLERIRRLKAACAYETALQCLLITQSKLDAVKAQTARKTSHWNRLTEHGEDDVPHVLLTWEQFAEHRDTNAKVADFIRKRLDAASPPAGGPTRQGI